VFLPKAENLVVLRTFSKAWAGAALRLGYMLGAPPTVLQVRKALLPYNVNAVSAALGVLALRTAPLFESRVKATMVERARLYDALSRQQSLTVYPSDANFILVRLVRGSATEAYRLLKRKGILVRDVSHLPGLDHCLRLSVGTLEEDDAVLRALAEVLS
jgi:histidinol-phosphate aminotransferase